MFYPWFSSSPARDRGMYVSGQIHQIGARPSPPSQKLQYALCRYVRRTGVPQTPERSDWRVTMF